ncbi:hypothetical protein JRO89_XS13G0001900 [Xanthoceras sorbifolium]|uniref:Uncharacterized protein n=1 Tax=Xanthoceras sorbifolium TaxID=99658 RepID=A0ABQ8H5R8_9ROSI|nr:hypothetical protein JRO89_XS13G0001900 [Xanthoceras sorbifolium]
MRSVSTTSTTSSSDVLQWNSPLPYLFGGLLLIFIVIAVALFFLACCHDKSSSDHEKEEMSSKTMELPADSEPKIVVLSTSVLDGYVCFFVKKAGLGQRDGSIEANREVDSDDSMASDASSGIAHYKNNEEEDGDIDGKCTTTISGSDKKAKRQMGKQLQKRDQMMFKEKEDKKKEVMFLAKRGGGSTTPAQSDSKTCSSM